MKKINVLSIDDETGFVELLKQYFEPRGYNFDITSDSSKGLDLLQSNKYDVCLLDLRMAGLDGDEVLTQIKKSHVDTKIIFVTAYNDSGKTKKRLLKEGAYAFVEKPIVSLKYLEDIITGAAEAAR